MNSPKLPLAVPAPAPRDTAQRWAAPWPGTHSNPSYPWQQHLISCIAGLHSHPL